MKVVIIGAGEVGFHIARRLALEQKEVVVVDENEAAIRRVGEHLDVQAIQGSGSNPEMLELAGIKDADIMLAVTNSDETNLVACLMADLISPSIKKLARVRHAAFDPFQNALRENSPHINTLINPEIEVCSTIWRLMRVPGAVDVSEFADGRVFFVGIRLEADAKLAGVRLADLPRVLNKRGPLIAALVRNEQMSIPGGEDRLQPGDTVYFVCEKDKLTRTLQIFDKQPEPLRRALIVGGGRTGMRLAGMLVQNEIHTKLIERDAERCNQLAERLDRVLILNGDGSDQELLAEENIGSIDVFVALTGDEETNILASLLARKMGARKSITRIDRFSYFSLMSAIGIDQVVSPRLSAINTILQHIRRGKVLSAISLKGEQAEVLEAVAMETSDIVGHPLHATRMPKGALIIGIIRGVDFIIPDGNSVILPGDRIIIFTHRQAVSQIERILAVKLEYF